MTSPATPQDRAQLLAPTIASLQSSWTRWLRAVFRRVGLFAALAQLVLMTADVVLEAGNGKGFGYGLVGFAARRLRAGATGPHHRRSFSARELSTARLPARMIFGDAALEDSGDLGA